MIFSRILLILTFAAYVITGPVVVIEECVDYEFTTTTPPVPQKCHNETVFNIALKKPTEQSSTYLDYESTKAVDGNTSQWLKNGSCTQTNHDPAYGDTKPWLIVELGKPHVVEYVKMYSRNDPGYDHFNYELEVQAGDHWDSGTGHRFSNNPVCDRAPGGGYPTGHVFRFDCPRCMAGSFVSIQITQDINSTVWNVLSVCELEIYGYPLPP